MSSDTQARFNPLEYPLAFASPLDVRAISWHEHIPFAMALVQMIAPRVFVELGVHTGDSYLAFCQAVAALRAGTSCFGVDTWRGDAHAGFFGDEILGDLHARHDPKYGGFSKLVQATFDEAAGSFQPESIDLLHIDGFHTYEAVLHDFETWLPKISRRGVVLMHDVCVRERDFGVYRLWGELATRWPSFVFEHGYGLGVLAVGPEVPLALQPLLALGPMEQASIRGMFEALGKRVGAEARCHALEAVVAARDKVVAELEARLAASEACLAASEARLAASEAACAERDRALSEHRGDLERTRQLLRDAEAKADAIWAAHSAVTGSVSWKIGRGMTAPLRRLLGRK